MAVLKGLHVNWYLVFGKFHEEKNSLHLSCTRNSDESLTKKNDFQLHQSDNELVDYKIVGLSLMYDDMIILLGFCDVLR